MSSLVPSAAAHYQRALAWMRAGDLQRAESACRDIQARQPHYVDAYLLCGVIQLQTRRATEALTSFCRVFELDASSAIAHALHGDAHMDLGQPGEALHSYEMALKLTPDLLPGLFGRGNALLDLLRYDEAVACYERVLNIDPHRADVSFNLANVWMRLKQFEKALACYERAIEDDPKYASALSNRGSVLRILGRTEEAIKSFDAAIRIDSNLTIAYVGRAHVLLLTHQTERALTDYEHALRLDPALIEAHTGRLDALLAQKRFAQALDGFAALLLLQPDNPNAWRDLGELLLMQHRPLDAIPCFLRALQGTDAHSERAAGQLLHAQLEGADWSVRHPLARADNIEREILKGKSLDSPFSFLFTTDSSLAQRRCAEAFLGRLAYPSAPSSPLVRSRNSRIRLAYVSPDLGAHALSYLLAGVFEQHDRQQFEVTAISLRPEEQNPMGARMRGAFERFVDASGMSDGKVASLLHDLQIDIAVDLVGYTDGYRPGIFSSRPAPVQVNYLGFPGTSGASWIDYLLADRFVVPPERFDDYSEQIVHLPHCFQANDDRRSISPRRMTRLEAGLPETGIVFCCFNVTSKLNPRMFDTWVKILRRVPDSVLWLLSMSEGVVENLQAEAKRRDVDPQRLRFSPRIEYSQHLSRLQLADLFLDTLPFNAGASASDALWAGLPVLTCAGQAFAARMAGSLLHAVGLPDLVTFDLTSYESRAVELAGNPDELRNVKRRLINNRDSAPLFDTRRFTRYLERAFQRMHQNHLDGHPPKSFAVPEN